ncbi:MAG: hypothetical protein ACXVLQ_12630 [Bacteriovorax sp.]
MAETLNRVEVSGNKKTTKEAIILHAQIKVNEELTKERLKVIEENLRRINQFTLKKIDFQNGVLYIDIIDKWTLFPVPMIAQSGHYRNYGFLLYEDNIFGSLGTFSPGVSWSNSVFNALLYYQDESLFSPVAGIKVLLMRKSDYVEFKRNDVVTDVHESRYNSFLITPNYLYKNQVFKAGPMYIDKKILNIKGDEIFRDKSSGLFFRHHLNAFQALEIMYEGLVTTYDIYALKRQGGKWIVRNEADVKWSLPVELNFFNLGLHAHHSTDTSYLFPKILGGDEGYRGYDKSSLPASRNAGALIQYQQHLFKRIFLTPFYEYNSSKLIAPIQNGRTLNENTFGAGIRYYFKKISIPAVMFDVARNIDDKSTHFHFNVGVSL